MTLDTRTQPGISGVLRFAHLIGPAHPGSPCLGRTIAVPVEDLA